MGDHVAQRATSGRVSATLLAALLRTLLVAFLTTGSAYFTALQTVEDDCQAVSPPLTEDCETGRDTKETKARNIALAALFAALLARFGIEGGVDAVRQSRGTVSDADVQANTAAPPRSG